MNRRFFVSKFIGRPRPKKFNAHYYFFSIKIKNRMVSMKKHFTVAAIFAAAALLAVLPAQTRAQYTSSYIYNNNAFLNYALASQRAEETRRGLQIYSSDDDAASGGGRARNNGNAVPNKKIVRGAAQFNSTGTYIFPKEFAQKFGRNDKEKREMESAFVRGLDDFEGTTKSRGYRTNDVARSSTSLFVISLSYYYGNELTQKQKDGIYNAFTRYYESDARFQTLNDREKQKIYEGNAILWSFVFISGVVAQEKNDEASRKKTKEAAETIFSVFLGIPISKVHLNPNGMKID